METSDLYTKILKIQLQKSRNSFQCYYLFCQCTSIRNIFLEKHNFSSLFDTIYVVSLAQFFQLCFHGELLRDETNDRT